MGTVESVSQIPQKSASCTCLNVLVCGHIFLNCSFVVLSFLEAALGGLLVISTNIGGVPEVLPHNMMPWPSQMVLHL